MTMPAPDQVVTINVDRTEVAQRGQKGGKPWVKYAVFGTWPDGSTLPAAGGPPFYTFDRVNVGPVEVTIEPYTKHGSIDVLSFTIKRVKSAPKATRPGGGADPDELNDLRDRVETLESQVARILSNQRTGVSA